MQRGARAHAPCEDAYLALRPRLLERRGRAETVQSGAVEIGVVWVLALAGN